MKISEAWLRSWVDPSVGVEALAEQLTFAGLEVEAILPCPVNFTNVIVGRILDVHPHPAADKLSICKVDSGKHTLQIVCGAPNAHRGLRAPLALVGAILPEGRAIQTVKLRGVESAGMLCSAKELGLSDDATGLMTLAGDAPVGKPLGEYLELPDNVLEIKLTPNRADCLCIAGCAREVAAIYRLPVRGPKITVVRPMVRSQLTVGIEAREACPRYVGRVIKGLRPGAVSPTWLAERLRRSGMRTLHPVVDVTNYVMLELGQPMHAFDLQTLHGGIVVRWARAGEALKLLDDRRIDLAVDDLVIADAAKPKALAGIMGGQESAVQAHTVDVFLESACFMPTAIMGRARRYGLATDASHRFERGVDPALARRAMERATELLLSIVGGQAGPIVEARTEAARLRSRPILLRRQRLAAILGMAVADRDVMSILRRLGMRLTPRATGWQVVPPSFRFDLTREEDVIEEVGRIHGFDRIPVMPIVAPIRPGSASEYQVAPRRFREALVHRGYAEVINYSFGSQRLDTWLTGDGIAVELANPISAELTHLRRSLWPGLVQTLKHNLNRQQGRVRIFELGRKYMQQGVDIKEKESIAALAYGPVEPEQWGLSPRLVAFADMKSDIEALCAMTKRPLEFLAARHQALHPGRAAEIYAAGHSVGWLGELHPELVKRLDLPASAVVFELDLAALCQTAPTVFQAVSRFPAVRRDIAVVVAETVSGQALRACVHPVAPGLIQEVILFDIYRGPGIDSGRKSVALGLILQDSSRTLTVEAADEIMSQVVERLRHQLGATIRD